MVRTGTGNVKNKKGWIMFTYEFFQAYWWFIVSLLAGILVFLMFVQGGNSLLFKLAPDEEGRRLLINSTGRKWEFTFTTLVTFGGAFFASFPLFYSTSFGGAYWLWMLILLSFVLQAVSYEFQGKMGNLLGKRTYRVFLVLNGFLGPFLLGMAVATFFNGANFMVEKDMMSSLSMPVISRWGNAAHGLDAFLDPWNIVLGFAVLFLARLLGGMYFINNIDDAPMQGRFRHQLVVDAVPFLLFFLAFVIRTLVKDGFAVNPENGTVYLEAGKYWHNFIQMPVVALVFVAGVAGVLFGLGKSIFCAGYRKGIWFAGAGTVLTVLALLLCAGYNNTAYYPSNLDLQSSLTLANSCSSFFTLKVMSVVSLLVPFVFAYIFHAWRAIDRKKLNREELREGEHAY